MRFLIILYDQNCELCRRIRTWILSQPTYVELRFVAAASAEARRRFPSLNHASTLNELTVISNIGEVYYGAKAWVMCLWAMREYRAWSFKLSHPNMMPTARRFIAWISRNRHHFGRTQAFLRGERPNWNAP